MQAELIARRKAHTESVLRAAGLDLAHWFSVAGANARLDHHFALPGEHDLGLLVGNTRALWVPFSAYREERGSADHPLDAYVEEHILQALRHWEVTWLRFSHQFDEAPVPIQRYSEASGFAPRGPVDLCVHPVYGTWFALRAIAVVAGPRPETVRTEHHPCRGCIQPCVPAMQSALARPEASLRRFLGVRDACPLGHEHRYDEAQIAFHYGRRSVHD